MPEPDVILAPEATTYRFGLEPALNSLNSLLLISREEDLSGLGEWITRTAQALTPQELHTNRLVMEGLHYAILPERSLPSFPAYLDALASLSGEDMRQRLLDSYLQLACLPERTTGDPLPSHEALIASVDVYLDFLAGAFHELDRPLESEAHALVTRPDTLRRVVLDHLNMMWREYLAPEWERNLQLLQELIDAFRQVRLEGLGLLEATRTVTGHPTPDDKWLAMLAHTRRIAFVPSAHVGPYLGKLSLTSQPDLLYMVYRARLPEGVQATRATSPLSRAELLVRLNALADETRLRILALIAEQGELCAQDVITALDLSQSAASRHLTQLSSTGYLIEHRRENAKCYRLNPERVDDTLDALRRFLRLNRAAPSGRRTL